MDLAAIALAFFIVAASPGPATLGCAAVSMAHGRAAGLAFGAGLGMGLTVWGILAALGLGAVLASSAWLLTVLKIAGGLYLLWLAYGSGRAALAPAPQTRGEVEAGRWLWRGLALNLSNPKAIFAWVATLSIGLDPTATVITVALATVICAAIGFAIYALWALGFSHTRVMALYQRGRRWVQGAVAVLFATAGLGLIRSAVARTTP